ncbi:hypothetical protein GCM10027268_21170 [Brachybacterium huguangmaarense]
MHNTEAEAILSTLDGDSCRRIEVSELHDGIPSPAGPFNLALDEARGEYVSTLGSDDVLEPGALAAWYARAVETDADAVIAALRLGHQVVTTPYLRPGRRRLLDPVADGLAHRTAPLGLLRTATVRRIGFRYTEGGHRAGEDIEPALRMWFRGGRIAYPYAAPCYRVLEDMGAARATAGFRPLGQELGYLTSLLGQEWLLNARSAERTAITTKLARSQVVGSIRRRVKAYRRTGLDAVWSMADAVTCSRVVQHLRYLAGDGLGALSRSESAVLDRAQTAHDAEALSCAWAGAVEGAAQSLRRVLPVRTAALLSPAARPRTFCTQQIAQHTGSFTHPVPHPAWVAGLDRAREA